MYDWLLLTVLLVAIATGWYLGRYGKSPLSLKAEKSDDYLKGLDFILQEQPAETVDSFLSNLAVNSETVDTHLALGRFFRGRGEVDKATLVHQNLLARPALSKSKTLTVQFELARDYMTAGLFDRAERLLEDLVTQPSEFLARATKLLIDIYEREKEWQRALDVAMQASLHKRPKSRHRLAHYCCELAREKQKTGEFNAVRKLLKQALRLDSSCVRASLLLGQFELTQGHHKDALRILLKVKDQDADYLPLALPDIHQAYRGLDRESEYVGFLESILTDRTMLSAALALAEHKRAAGATDESYRYLAGYLAKQPSFRGLAHLMKLNAQVKSGETTDNMAELLDHMLEHKPVHACSDCGFKVKRITWLCPGCREWGTIKPIYGFDGE